MVESTKETVIVVHGTWAEPHPGVTKWYQPAEGERAAGEFVAKLDEALKLRGSNARCWAHCAETAPDFFHWSGENSWVERIHAASSLDKYIANLPDDCLCHIVAHSHGGTVVSEAFAERLATRTLSARVGKIVTLGTPFVCTMPYISNKKKRADANIFLVLFIGVVIFLSVTLLGVYSGIYATNNNLKWMLYGIAAIPFAAIYPIIGLIYSNPLLFIGIILSVILINWRFGVSYRVGACLKSLVSKLIPRKYQTILMPGQNTKLLCISSYFDETWQVLHHLQNSSNQFCKIKGMNYIYKYVFFLI